MSLSDFPPDVQAILAAKNAQIAAARQLRQDRSGTRDWKTPMPPRYVKDYVRANPTQKKLLSRTERAVLLAFIAGPKTTMGAAVACHIKPDSAKSVIATLKKTMTAREIRFTDLRLNGGPLTIHDLEAARALLA